MQDTNQTKAFSQSSIRLLEILECLSANVMPMKLQDISKRTGIAQSTILRYLNVLISKNYVYQSPDTGRYALTWKLCSLTENLNSDASLRGITGPYVNALALSLNTGICLVTEKDGTCLYLDCIDPPGSRTLQRIGYTAPLHTTASGKILLSRKNNNQLDHYIEINGLSQFTKYTITDESILKEEMKKVRQQDYAVDDEECEIGLRCISCPLRDYTGQIIASMSAFSNKYDMTNEYVQHTVYPALKKATVSISICLGFNFNNEEISFSLKEQPFVH